jgi:prepilin-type N-terminal cleavage/methylation domain-containing protein
VELNQDWKTERGIKMIFSRKKQKGFTLIEVMLVVVIIAIIAIIALPKLLVTRTQAAQDSCDSNLQALRTQIEQYNWQEGFYPSSLPALLNDDRYFPEDSTISGECPLDKDPLDDTNISLTGQVTCPNHLTN